jgi:hypothetical protein
MTENEILRELQSLPVSERLKIIEFALEDITDLERAERRARRAEMKQRLASAAEKAKPYYEVNNELTAFTALDSEDFIDNE